jgi:peptide/nickel transport system ATP-binding protein
VLEVRDLAKSFGPAPLFEGVDLDVAAGERVALVGESGSGKSVTGLSIMRLFGRTGAHIDAGELRFRSSSGAMDLARLDEDRMARIRGQEIAIIFQDPMSSLNPVLTVGDQIGEGLRVHKGLSRAAARKAAIALLARVGIPAAAERVSAYPHQFSGGMRQRVMIAIALAASPRLLIADEPTTALDVTIQGQILFEMQKLTRETGAAMIWITHDLSVVAGLADHVSVMYAGRIVEQGSVFDVLSRPRHPYTQGLLDSVPSRSVRGARLKQIPGMPPSVLDLPEGCAFRERCSRATEICATMPQMLPVGAIVDGHPVRCHHPLDAPAAP